MFDSREVLQSWAIPYLEEAAGAYRGIVEIRDVRVSMEMDPGDGLHHSDRSHICGGWCDYPQSVIVLSGVGVRASGSQVRLSYELDAEAFSFVDFLDEIQGIAES